MFMSSLFFSFFFKECLAIFGAPDPVASLSESCRESWTFFPTSHALITAYSPRVWCLRAHAMDTASATLASSRSHAIVRHNGKQHTPGAPQPQHSRQHCAGQGGSCVLHEVCFEAPSIMNDTEVTTSINKWWNIRSQGCHYYYICFPTLKIQPLYKIILGILSLAFLPSLSQK